MYGAARSPNAVAAAGTRCTAGPNVQIEAQVISDGFFAICATMVLIASSSSERR